MKTELALLKQTRTNISGFLKSIPRDKMTVIPAGFRNHLLWNAGHLLVTQQLLCYKNAGLPMLLNDQFIDRYRKGTEPQKVDVSADLAVFENHFLPFVDQLAADYQAGKFSQYQTYPTSYNFTLNSIEDAIAFNNTHEGLHFGYMMAMRRALI